MKKFSITEREEARAYYKENGYVIFSRLLAHDKIDAFMRVYEQTKGDRMVVFSTQSTHRPMVFVPDEYGHIPESMENPTHLALTPTFCRSVRECILSKEISEGLTVVDGQPDHVLWQSMFFDKSTGTVEHQDTWYLDTVPRGGVIGTWMALEDIAPDSGPFILYPGSHNLPAMTPEQYASHDEFVRATNEMLSDLPHQAQVLTLDRGDVVFWHPSTIHGALANENPERSRKSFTAHFYPMGVQTDDRATPWPVRPVGDHLYERRINNHAYHARQYVRMAVRKVLGRNSIFADMRRTSY